MHLIGSPYSKDIYACDARNGSSIGTESISTGRTSSTTKSISLVSGSDLHKMQIPHRTSGLLLASMAALLLLAVLVLSGCDSGSAGGSTPTVTPVGSAYKTDNTPTITTVDNLGQATPIMSSGDQTGSATDGSTGVTGLDANMAPVVENWIASQDIPYRNLSGKVISQDDAFATIQVNVEMRKSADSPWLSYQGEMELKEVNGVWQKSKVSELVSEQLQATQTALVTATAVAMDIAEAKAYTQTALEGLPVKDIQMLSPTEGWAVGGLVQKYNGGVVWHLLNAKWVPEYYRGNIVESIGMISNKEGWVIASGPNLRAGTMGFVTAYRYIDGAWIAEPSATAATSATGSVVSGADGKGYTLANLDSSALATQMLSPSEGWAVSRSYIVHYIGGRWQVQLSPVKDVVLSDISFSAPNDGWVVGDTAVMHWDGDTWTSQSITEPLLKVSTLPSGDAWAIGAHSVEHYTKGGKWESVSGLSQFVDNYTQLTDIAAMPSGEVWVSGYTQGYADNETFVLHYHDNSWTKSLRLPNTKADNSTGVKAVNNKILTLSMLSSGSGWAGGEADTDGNRMGLLIELKNGNWSTYAWPTSAQP